MLRDKLSMVLWGERSSPGCWGRRNDNFHLYLQGHIGFVIRFADNNLEKFLEEKD